MRIEEALAGVLSLGIEASPFIYFAEGRASYAARMRVIFRRVKTGDLTVTASAITLTEVLAKPLTHYISHPPL